MAMPMTLPCGLVVKNAEEISSIFSVGNPSRITARELELTLLASRLHQELAARVLHGFDGVEHEVHKPLLQVHAVGHDFGQVGCKFLAHCHRNASRESETGREVQNL